MKTSTSTDTDWLLLSSSLAGDKASCEAAIAQGARLGAVDHEGRSALSIALIGKHKDLAHWLALRMDAAELSLVDDVGVSAVDCAVANDDVGLVRLLGSRGADMEAPVAGSGITTLMHAAARRDGAVIQALLDAGANPRARDKCGDCAMIRAIAKDNLEALMALAPVSDHAMNKRGISPFMSACKGGSLASVRALISAEAASTADPEGMTPLAQGIHGSREDLGDFVDLLLPYSNPWAKDCGGRTPLSWLASETQMEHPEAGRIAGCLADAMLSSEARETATLVELSMCMGMAMQAGNKGVAKALSRRVEVIEQRILLASSVSSVAGRGDGKGKPRI